MELASVNTPTAALMAGLVTSLHCVGMCGPLACLLSPPRSANRDPHLVYATYHGARLLSYGLLGAAAGGLGAIPAAWWNLPLVKLLPWVMVAWFVAIALRLSNRWPTLALLGRMQLWLRAHLRDRSAHAVALGMGAATPLLPCGPLYFLVAIAGFAGSAAAGAELLLAFGLGTLPLLWLVQANTGWLRARLSPVGLARAQTTLATAAVLMLLWRLRGDLGLSTTTNPASFVCH